MVIGELVLMLNILDTRATTVTNLSVTVWRGSARCSHTRALRRNALRLVCAHPLLSVERIFRTLIGSQRRTVLEVRRRNGRTHVDEEEVLIISMRVHADALR